ncbi:MAG: hypothetical protein CMLOHMNK_03065 [Steroidobacteraceae bacterium]|nr:hypothetical protein [Steroidobacteraceae bacterium]
MKKSSNMALWAIAVAGATVSMQAHAVPVAGTTSIWAPTRACRIWSSSGSWCELWGTRTDYYDGAPGDATSTIDVTNVYGSAFAEASLTGEGSAPVIRARAESTYGTRINTLTSAIQSYTYAGAASSARTFGGMLTYSLDLPPGWVLPPGDFGDTATIYASIEVFRLASDFMDLPDSSPQAHWDAAFGPITSPGYVSLGFNEYYWSNAAAPSGFHVLSTTVTINPGDTIWVRALMNTPAANGVVVDASSTFITAFDDFSDLTPRLAIAVPEPGTLASFVVGIAGAALVRRRKVRIAA